MHSDGEGALSVSDIASTWMNNGTNDDAFVSAVKYEDPEVIIDPRLLLAGKRSKRREVRRHHNMCLKRCWNEVILANQRSIVALEFAVPEHVLGLEEYNAFDCMQYIKQRFEEKCINVMIVGRSRLFVSWHDVEERLNHDHGEK